MDLNNFRRRWQIGNGWTYDVAIADIQKSIGYEGVTFSLGDYVTAEDSFICDSVKNRIISYTENDDNPSENSITLGVFIADTESKSAETDRIANEAKQTADNSVQQGERYSNVSITHKDGFVASNKAGTQRVMMNGDDCFIVQVKQNGEWVTVNSLEVFGLLVDRLTNKDAKNSFYVTVGRNEDNNDGLFIFSKRDGEWQRFFDFWLSANKKSVIESKINDLIIMCPSDKEIIFCDKEGNSKGTLLPNGNYSGTFSYKNASDNISTVYVSNGIIKNIE